MNKSQLNVKIDTKIRDNAIKKANEDNISMAFLIEALLSLYIDGKITVKKKTIYDIKINSEEKAD